MIDPDSPLARYISVTQKELIQEGFYLLEDVKTHAATLRVHDYSFVVFPFAKAYEGFLKQLFLDLGFIKNWQYESDHLRIGKVLSPGLVRLLRERSVYKQLEDLTGSRELPDKLWDMWKRGRNQIFHYYPHNVLSISLPQAEGLAHEIVSVMEEAVELYYQRGKMR